MTFPAAVSDGYASLFELLAVPAVYTPPGGAPVATRAHLHRAAELVGEYGVTLDRQPVLTLPNVDIGRPQKGAAVLREGETWLVDRVIEDNGHKTRSVVRAAS
ncbi:MAG: hypothetical protein L0H19_07935 [Salinisphaera sp.]|nr:hypothetical protein [Salinisphaera sp.]